MSTLSGSEFYRLKRIKKLIKICAGANPAENLERFSKSRLKHAIFKFFLILAVNWHVSN